MNTTAPQSPLQTWDPHGYAANARFVSDLGSAVVDLLAPKAGERILDLGCGDGALTRKLIEAGANVVGVDTSPQFVAAAQTAGIDAHLMSGERLTFAGEFDAVFSNAALHWMTDAEAVVAGVFRALKPGGRFVGEFGGHGNVAAICTGVVAALQLNGFHSAPRMPWFYPTPAQYKRLLNAHGFAVNAIDLFPRPTPLPTGMRGWLETFANPFFRDVPAERRPTVLDQAVELLRPSLCDAEGQWTADYVRLRFKASKAV